MISTLILNKLDENKKDKLNDKYEIKGITGTDNFVNSCLSDFIEKIKEECLKTPSALAKLRKLCDIA